MNLHEKNNATFPLANRLYISLIAFFCFLPLLAAAQDRPFNDATRPFFEAQVPYLNHWLDKNGLGAVLAYESLGFRPDMLTVYFYLRPHDRDSAAAAYVRLRSDYALIARDSLEEALFGYTAFLMEVEPERLTIEIYDVPEKDPRTPCFYKAIFFENAQLLTEASSCRDQETELEIASFELKDGVVVRETEIESASPEYLTKKRVFEEIETFAREYFELREGKFAVLKRGQVLTFESKDMEREVLPASFFDWFTGAKKEWLRFTVNYENKGESINLLLKVHGKFGSGLFSLLDSGYRPMEPDYESELGRFTERFGEELRRYLVSRE